MQITENVLSFAGVVSWFIFVLFLMRRIASRALRRACGLDPEWSKRISGRELYRSRRGTAAINGIPVWGGVQIRIYEGGVVVHVATAGGRGGVWLPIQLLQIFPVPWYQQTSGWSRLVTDSRHWIYLNSELAQDVALDSAIADARLRAGIMPA